MPLPCMAGLSICSAADAASVPCQVAPCFRYHFHSFAKKRWHRVFASTHAIDRPRCARTLKRYGLIGVSVRVKQTPAGRRCRVGRPWPSIDASVDMESCRCTVRIRWRNRCVMDRGGRKECWQLTRTGRTCARADEWRDGSRRSA